MQKLEHYHEVQKFQDYQLLVVYQYNQDSH